MRFGRRLRDFALDLIEPLLGGLDLPGEHRRRLLAGFRGELAGIVDVGETDIVDRVRSDYRVCHRDADRQNVRHRGTIERHAGHEVLELLAEARPGEGVGVLLRGLDDRILEYVGAAQDVQLRVHRASSARRDDVVDVRVRVREFGPAHGLIDQQLHLRRVALFHRLRNDPHCHRAQDHHEPNLPELAPHAYTLPWLEFRPSLGRARTMDETSATDGAFPVRNDPRQ